MTDLSGYTLGRYQLIEQLGRGGMATVYKAFQPSLDRYVAIKVLHPHLADQPEFITRFEREARAIARLRHPHIIQVFDFDKQDDWYFIAMEFVAGSRTLKELLSELAFRGEHLPLLQTLNIIAKVADALDYSHQQGMVHRDVKPSNILIPKINNPMLTDFGIAHLSGLDGLTVTGVNIGTPSYMSPEQGQGETATERSDIYALGIVLYECLTGKPPYDADTPFSVILKHINAPLPLPRKFVPDLPDEVERIVLKSLAKNAEDRYAYAAQMRDSLNLAAEKLKGEDVTEDMTLVDLPHVTERQNLVDATTMVEEIQDTPAPMLDIIEERDKETPIVSNLKKKSKKKVWGMVSTGVLLLAIIGYFIVRYVGAMSGQTLEVSLNEIAICPGWGTCESIKLLDDPFRYSNASWSPDGKQIVFSASQLDYFWGLYIADLEGNVKPLIPSGTTINCMDPAWSPDGEWIAFHGDGELNIIKPDGTGRRVLAYGNDTNCPFGIAWSPDSQLIAWIGGTCGVSRTHIHAIKKDGTGYKRIYFSFDGGIKEGMIAWSPEGTDIVFMDEANGVHQIKVDCKSDFPECIAGLKSDIDEFPVRWLAKYNPQWAIKQ